MSSSRASSCSPSRSLLPSSRARTASEEPSVDYLLTPPFPCPYLPGVTARSCLVLPRSPLTSLDYEAFLLRGFRRGGLYLYAPQCVSCCACIAVRIPVDRFTPNRSQRRTWAKLNPILTPRQRPLFYDPEHHDLYRRYVQHRHGHTLAETDPVIYRETLLVSPFDSRLVEFRTPTGALKIVALIDLTPNALSAVYTWYDPDDSRCSYGTYAILWQIATARRLGIGYLYLGYTIATLSKMAYKTRFRPAEYLEPLRTTIWRPDPPIFSEDLRAW
ncbi:MAG: arginyltransferase [Hydrogenophilus sp.]|nr:arginyltransferase [Hydrogenophilus sp.]